MNKSVKKPSEMLDFLRSSFLVYNDYFHVDTKHEIYSDSFIEVHYVDISQKFSETKPEKGYLHRKINLEYLIEKKL